MRDWMTADEIAKLNLPDLPTSGRRVADRAKKDGWKSHKREGSGGGREYSLIWLLANLPKEARDALFAMRVAALAPKTNLVSPEAVEAAERLTEAPTKGAAQGRRDTRIEIVNLYQIFLLQSGMTDGTFGRLRFADLYNAAMDDGIGADTLNAVATVGAKRYALAVPAWMRKVKSSIAPSSLWNWQQQIKAGEIEGLGGRYKARKSVLDQAAQVRDYILGSVLKGRDISANQMRDEVIAQFGEKVEVVDADGVIDSGKIPSAGQICRWVRDWKTENADFLLHETNPDKWKSKNRISLGDLYGHIDHPNQLWEIDASPADLLLLEDDGRTSGRYTLYVLIDIYTRRIMVLVTKTAATAGALLLLKKGIDAWGKPEMVRTDQGSDFISMEAKRFFALMGIIHDDCTAYSPEQKGGVERHVKTVQHGIINQLPGYIGHSVADRSKIESIKAFADRLGQSDKAAYAITMTRDDLQATLSDWCEFKYAHKSHGGLKGETPFNRFVRWPGKVVRIDDPARLAMLLAPVPKSSKGAGIRTVTKYGVQVEDAHFYCDAMLTIMGDDVFVRMDPDDMGQVWIFAADHSAFIGRAICIERLGVDRAACAAEAKARQAAQQAELRKESRRLKASCKPHKAIQAVLAKAKNDAARVSIGPRQSESFTNSALDAIGDALSINKPYVSAPRTPTLQRSLDRLKAEMAQQAVQPVPETPKARYRRALDLRTAIDAKKPVDATALQWLKGYETTTEFRTQRDLHDEWGEGYLGRVSA